MNSWKHRTQASDIKGRAPRCFTRKPTLAKDLFARCKADDWTWKGSGCVCVDADFHPYEPVDAHSDELLTATVGVALEVGQLLSTPKVSVTLVMLYISLLYVFYYLF